MVEAVQRIIAIAKEFQRSVEELRMEFEELKQAAGDQLNQASGD